MTYLPKNLLQSLSCLGQSRVALRQRSVSGNNFASRRFSVCDIAYVYLIFLSQTAILFLLFLLFQSMTTVCMVFKFFLTKNDMKV